MLMTLGEKQQQFVVMIAQLILWCDREGYKLTFGEAYRTPEQAQWNAERGIGITNSLHARRLAIDLNLFIEGVYQTTTESHRPLGEKWKSMHELCRWGGDFAKPDGNHYSMEHEGVK